MAGTSRALVGGRFSNDVMEGVDSRSVREGRRHGARWTCVVVALCSFMSIAVAGTNAGAASFHDVRASAAAVAAAPSRPPCSGYDTRPYDPLPGVTPYGGIGWNIFIKEDDSLKCPDGAIRSHFVITIEIGYGEVDYNTRLSDLKKEYAALGRGCRRPASPAGHWSFDDASHDPPLSSVPAASSVPCQDHGPGEVATW